MYILSCLTYFTSNSKCQNYKSNGEEEGGSEGEEIEIFTWRNTFNVLITITQHALGNKFAVSVFECDLLE